MTVVLKAFKYSGSKTRYLTCYKRPPRYVRRVVEPYLGSGAFVLNAMNTLGVDGIGYEVSSEIVSLWRWLQLSRPQDIYDLDRLVVDTYRRKGRFDVRDLDIHQGALTYLRLHVCAIPRGLLRGYLLMPNLKLPVATTIASLPIVRRLKVVHASGHSHLEDGRDFWFIDPPYVINTDRTSVTDAIKTSGYSDDALAYQPAQTQRLLERIARSGIMTYGSRAKRVFPSLAWRPVDVRGVGGNNHQTSYRVEHVAYLNDWT